MLSHPNSIEIVEPMTTDIDLNMLTNATPFCLSKHDREFGGKELGIHQVRDARAGSHVVGLVDID